MADEEEVMQYEWRCKECEAKQPATSGGFAVMIRHQKGHHTHLVNIATGEEVATSLTNARVKGIDIPGAKESPAHEAGQRDLVLTQGGIKVNITLPALAWAMFDVAGAYELLEEGEDSLDSWIFRCMEKRFELDYGVQFGLQQIEKSDGQQEATVTTASAGGKGE